MAIGTCPHCKEEIKARALKCKHCNERLLWTREEITMAKIDGFLATISNQSGISLPGGYCEGFCRSAFKEDSPERKQCLDNCTAASAIAAVAARLQQDLHKSFFEVVWTGGDIDPTRFKELTILKFLDLNDIQYPPK